MSVQGCRACGRRLGARHAATCTLMDVIDPWVIWRLMQRDRAEFSRAFHGAEILPWRTHWLACARQLGGRVVAWHCATWEDAPDATVVAVIDGQVHELDGAAPRRAFREQLRLVVAA